MVSSYETQSGTMDRKLHICHVITRMIIGGAQENTLLTVKGLAQRGHEVTLITGPTTGPEGKLLDQVETSAVEIVEEPTLVRPLNLLQDARAWSALEQYFKLRGFDVIHTHSSKAGVLGRIAGRRAACPLVVHTVHGQPFHPYERWWKNRLYIAAERFAARRCDRIYAVCQAMIEQCVEAGIASADMYQVVYSGMEQEPFINARPCEQLRDELGIPAGVPVIGKVARLSELKGHSFLLDAAPAIVEAFPDVRFLLVGDGNLREDLEERVKRAGLEKNVVFAGLISPAAIPRYFALMDILVHLSLREGLPRSVVQGFAAGLPAVTFNLDGAPEVVHPGETGYLCEPKNSLDVKEALLDLLKNPAKAREMGRNGCEYVQSRFDWRKMVEAIEGSYYRELAKKIAPSSCEHRGDL